MREATFETRNGAGTNTLRHGQVAKSPNVPVPCTGFRKGLMDDRYKPTPFEAEPSPYALGLLEYWPGISSVRAGTVSSFKRGFAHLSLILGLESSGYSIIAPCP